MPIEAPVWDETKPVDSVPSWDSTTAIDAPKWDDTIAVSEKAAAIIHNGTVGRLRASPADQPAKMTLADVMEATKGWDEYGPGTTPETSKAIHEIAETAKVHPSDFESDPGTAIKVAAGIQNALVDTAAGLMEPENLALMGSLAGAPAALHKVVAGLFSLNIAKNIPEQAKKAGDLSVTGGTQEKTAAVANLALSTTLSGALAINAAKAGAPATAKAVSETNLKAPADEIPKPVESTVPETASTIQKQVDLTADPESTKSVTVVTPGEAMPTIPTWLETKEVETGTAIINPSKISPDEVTGKGTELGYSQDSKPDSNLVLQTKDASGTPVLDEVVTPEGIPEAVKAHQEAVPGGTQELNHAEEVVAERQKAPVETPLGINRPSVENKLLRSLSDSDFDSEFKAAKKEVWTAESVLDSVSDPDQLTESQVKTLAAAQDRWGSAELERERRNYSQIHTEDVFRKMLDLADAGHDFPKFKILTEILQERGGIKESDATGAFNVLPKNLLENPNFKESLSGKLEKLKSWLVRVSKEQAGPSKPIDTPAEAVSRVADQVQEVAPEPHDWTRATDEPKTTDQLKSGMKIKLGKKGNSGFVNIEILNDFVEYGKRVFEKGMDLAKWVSHVVSEFGESARKYATESWSKLKDAYHNSFLSDETGAIGIKAIQIKKRAPLDEATGERSARLQESFMDARRAQKEIDKAVPSAKRQAAISVWMEANGDIQTLAGWEGAAKGKVFKQAASDAQALTPKEIDIAQKSQKAFAIMEARGNSFDVLGSHRDNYVPHVWNVENNKTGIGASRLQDKFKFNKARTFDNFFQGDQAGFTPKTLAIGKLVPAYLHEMNKVIADRQFIQDVSGKLAKDGTPLVIPRGKITEVQSDSGGKAYLADPTAMKGRRDAAGNPIDQRNYKVLNNQPALVDWRWEGKDKDGNPIFMKDDLSVHPDLAKRLNAMMGRSAIREWYNEPSDGLAVIPKAIAKGLDTAQSVMKREMFGLLAPFHQVQEGTHAIGHLVNPFGHIPDMRSTTPEHLDAMRHGLMLQPDRASSSGFMEGVGGRGTFLTQAARFVAEGADAKVVSGAARMLADTVDGYQDYLFHQYIPGLKLKTYAAILERNMARYAKELASGEVSESDVKLLSATQTNAAFGHLNLALMDRNPTIQHLLQLGLLAPDFLEARGRFTGQALKSLAGEKSGNEQFKAIATLALVQAGIAYTVSTMLGDDWDWKHPFEVNHGGRRYSLRSVPEDLHRLFAQGPDARREFVSARINPLAQKADQLRTGLNYRGEKTGALDTVEELLANYIPITARSIPGVRDLTMTSKNNPVSPLEQLAGSLGLKISRFSPITQTHQLATEWMDKNKIERQQGTYPISKYQKLRYALEDGDMERAQKEFEALKASGGSLGSISKGFRDSIDHPFTKSKSMDAKFSSQLSGDDKLIYEHAVEVRRGILEKYRALPK